MLAGASRLVSRGAAAGDLRLLWGPGGWKTVKYAMQKELGYRVYLVVGIEGERKRGKKVEGEKRGESFCLSRRKRNREKESAGE